VLCFCALLPLFFSFMYCNWIPVVLLPFAHLEHWCAF
jgi:hypothetical protein